MFHIGDFESRHLEERGFGNSFRVEKGNCGRSELPQDFDACLCSRETCPVQPDRSGSSGNYPYRANEELSVRGAG